MVIAVDGPGGVGKSTVARRVAAELGYEHLDTGATYRAATLAVVRAGVDPEDEPVVTEIVRSLEMDYIDGVIYLDGEPVADEIRSSAVTAAVSAVSAMAGVRSVIVETQRSWVRQRDDNAVVDGRDIGTVVFPDAALKVFLTASPEVRAARRAKDAESGVTDVAAIAADLERRDRYDATRAVSPLRPADDAVIIDTSDLAFDDVVAAVLTLVDEGSDLEER